MILSIQIFTFIFSFLYGGCIYIFYHLFKKFLFSTNVFFKIVFSFIFCFFSSEIYFFSLLFLNYGEIHFYFLLLFFVGFLLFRYILTLK